MKLETNGTTISNDSVLIERTNFDRFFDELYGIKETNSEYLNELIYRFNKIHTHEALACMIKTSDWNNHNLEETECKLYYLTDINDYATVIIYEK